MPLKRDPDISSIRARLPDLQIRLALRQHKLEFFGSANAVSLSPSSGAVDWFLRAV